MFCCRIEWNNSQHIRFSFLSLSISLVSISIISFLSMNQSMMMITSDVICVQDFYFPSCCCRLSLKHSIEHTHTWNLFVCPRKKKFYSFFSSLFPMCVCVCVLGHRELISGFWFLGSFFWNEWKEFGWNGKIFFKEFIFFPLKSSLFMVVVCLFVCDVFSHSLITLTLACTLQSNTFRSSIHWDEIFFFQLNSSYMSRGTREFLSISFTTYTLDGNNFLDKILLNFDWQMSINKKSIPIRYDDDDDENGF